MTKRQEILNQLVEKFKGKIVEDLPPEGNKIKFVYYEKSDTRWKNPVLIGTLVKDVFTPTEEFRDKGQEKLL